MALKWQFAATLLVGLLVVAGGVTFSDLFGVTSQLTGIDYTYSGDLACEDDCVSYINLTTSYWRVCFEHTSLDQRMYIPRDTKLLKTTYSEYPDTVLYKKANYGRTLWVNLNNVGDNIVSRPGMTLFWYVPTYGKNWRDLKDGDCWDRGKTVKMKIVGVCDDGFSREKPISVCDISGVTGEINCYQTTSVVDCRDEVVQ